MIVIVDYHMGNYGSVLNMIKKAGYKAIITSDKTEINKAKKLILPGVGSFNNGIKNIEKLGLIDVLNEKVLTEKIPILGICLGAQLLTNKSEEGALPGLGWIDCETIKFNLDSTVYKVPHMGWNYIKITQDSSLFNNITEIPRFYFVHSYHFHCNDASNVLATSTYGYEFASIINKNNIYGVQFHPEKSHKYGLQLLKNFLDQE